MRELDESGLLMILVCLQRVGRIRRGVRRGRALPVGMMRSMNFFFLMAFAAGRVGLGFVQCRLCIAGRLVEGCVQKWRNGMCMTGGIPQLA